MLAYLTYFVRERLIIVKQLFPADLHKLFISDNVCHLSIAPRCTSQSG